MISTAHNTKNTINPGMRQARQYRLAVISLFVVSSSNTIGGAVLTTGRGDTAVSVITGAGEIVCGW
jgi:hypothetical protein